MMLHRKVVCLYGGYKSESKMKEFTCLIRNAFIRLRDNIHFIYVPDFILKAAEERPVTDNVVLFDHPLMFTLLHAEMEGMLLLNLSQHDVFRFWRRLIFLREEVPEIYNRDTDKLGALKKLLQCLVNENPWVILMDEEGNTITCLGTVFYHHALVFYHHALELSTLPHAEMEGMLLLNLSQHDAFRFWGRVMFLTEECNSDTDTEGLPEMYNSDTDKLGALKKLLQCWGNEEGNTITWMILMDEEGNTITESGRKLVLSCKGSTEDEARGLIELLMKGSKEQRKEAAFKLEQMPDVENYDG